MSKFIFFILISAMSFAQQNTKNIDDLIYQVVDDFVANPKQENLSKLNSFTSTIQPKSTQDFLALTILYCNKAYYENQFGLTQESISSYETAWQLFLSQKLMDYDIIEYCLKPLGNLYTKIGDYDNAEHIIKSYLYTANKENNNELIYAGILNLSNVYQASGKSELAIDLIKKSLKNTSLTEIQKASLFNNLGTNYTIQQQYELAEIAFKKAISILKNQNEPETASNSYRNLTQLYLQKNNLEKANQEFEQAKKYFFQIQNQTLRERAKFYLETALIYQTQKNNQQALLEISKIYTLLIPNFTKKTNFPTINQLYAETILLETLDLHATLLTENNQFEKALACYELAFEVEKLIQWVLIHENSKIINQLRNKNRVQKCLEVYTYLHKIDKNKAHLEKAFLLAEQNKFLVLRTEKENNSNRSIQEKKLMNELQNWNAIYLNEQNKSFPSIEKMNQAILKQNEIMLQLKSKEKKKLIEKKIDIKSLFTQLKEDDAVLISYFLGDQKLFLFKIENNELTLSEIKNTVKEKKIITDFLNYFNDPNAISNNSNGYNSQANLVYNFLKIPKKSTQKNLVIFPDGILNFLPFEALITKKTNNSSFAEMNYLLHDYKIGYQTSVYFYLNQKPLHHKSETILGVFPIFKNSSSELLFSKEEANFIKSHFKGLALENHEASFENFKKNSSNYSILHLSTHASAGDEFTPASIRFFDREVNYTEFYNLDTTSDLVVLSACETGIGKLYQSEGALSIARGFQMNGNQNLLFSLWKVNDYTTFTLMKNFYSNLKNDLGYFEANHQSKMDYLNDKNLSNSKKSPYYWSAMTYYGTFENKRHASYWFYLLLLPALALVIFIIRKYIR
ncbi:CHAT domain-containing protein [Flavobacterium azooxidireducens]|uniref:CHAT domain-containing protein n=1 Tax=Flavobacterium azooxidireducens TaxID=1871076 RepID=A0ABY4KH91_9FLAO|nr:CHAT domain-containing protein [Flavobacterium azooxidireducens]UPQ80184.1 CHAT domain-containing protein [Flavobacterium azooxidireducens]